MRLLGCLLGSVWLAGCAAIVSYGDYSRAESDASAGNTNDAASGGSGFGGAGGFPLGGTGGAPSGGAPAGGASAGGTSGMPSTGGTAGTPSGGNSGQGGSGGCVLASDCPPPDACFEGICDNGTCKAFAAPAGTLCNGAADQCDGFGFCVDCVDSGGCDECCICRLNLCIPS